MRPGQSEAESRRNSKQSNSGSSPSGFLADCMVDSSPNKPCRVIRAGTTVGISALAQAALLILFLIVPLFATTKLTMARSVIPIAPYGGPARRGQGTKPKENQRPPLHKSHIIADGPVVLIPTPGKKRSEATDDRGHGTSDAAPNLGPSTGDPNGKYNNIDGLIPILGTGDVPRPVRPEPEKSTVSKPIEVSQKIEMAQIVHRVEPIYPVMAIHNRIEGTVELRAVIGRDGAVREVQVLSGNAFLVLSAREAVLQWRFRPTLLNGQPVEVDTFFTVNFRINH